MIVIYCKFLEIFTYIVERCFLDHPRSSGQFISSSKSAANQSSEVQPLRQHHQNIGTKSENGDGITIQNLGYEENRSAAAHTLINATRIINSSDSSIHQNNNIATIVNEQYDPLLEKKSSYSGSAVQGDGNVATLHELKSPKASIPENNAKRRKTNDNYRHDNEAASSLLGFFNHLERNNSQEDLVEFFEGVQKNVAAASSLSPTTSAPHNDSFNVSKTPIK